MAAFLRTPITLPLAAGATVALFMGMRALIDIGDVTLPEDVPDIDIVMIDQPEPYDPDGRINRFEDIADVPPPPPPELIEVDRTAPESEVQQVSYTLPEIERPRIREGSGGLVSPDRTPAPVVRVDPVYPARMAERGIDGQCTAIFDITPQGTTTNIRILSCSNVGFERATRQAVSRWRYQPQVRDGEPVMFRGATTQLVYRLDA